MAPRRRSRPTKAPGTDGSATRTPFLGPEKRASVRDFRNLAAPALTPRVAGNRRAPVQRKNVDRNGAGSSSRDGAGKTGPSVGCGLRRVGNGAQGSPLRLWSHGPRKRKIHGARRSAGGSALVLPHAPTKCRRGDCCTCPGPWLAHRQHGPCFGWIARPAITARSRRSLGDEAETASVGETAGNSRRPRSLQRGSPEAGGLVPAGVGTAGGSRRSGPRERGSSRSPV